MSANGFQSGCIRGKKTRKIKEAYRQIFLDAGIRIPDVSNQALFRQEDAKNQGDVVFLNHALIERTLDMPYKGHALFGQDLGNIAVLDQGHHAFQSTSGQFASIELEDFSHRNSYILPVVWKWIKNRCLQVRTGEPSWK